MNCSNDNGNHQNGFLEATISSDLALKIIQYLNVIDSGRLACASQRYYYLVHQYRRLRGPELVTTSSPPSSSCPHHEHLVVKNSKEKLQNTPNLVLHFCNSLVSDSFAKKMSFGKDTVGLGAATRNEIQVYQPGPEGILEDESMASLMAMNFPGATILPFSIRGTPGEIDLDFLEGRLKYHSQKNNDDGDDDTFWKAMILYGTGSSSDGIIARMQAAMPNAVIVGGVCDDGHVSIPKFSKDELTSMPIKHLRYLEKMSASLKRKSVQRDSSVVEKSDLVNLVLETLNGAEEASENHIPFERIGFESFFGVFLGGDVPVKSVVSRGVHSLLNGNGTPRPFSNLVVETADLSKPDMEDYLFGGDGPPVHLIRSVKDKTSGATYLPMEIIEKFFSNNLRKAQFLGLKRVGHDGFELSEMNNLVMQLDMFVVVADGSLASEETLRGAELDFFSLNGRACMEDMDWTMSKLRDQTEGEQILGALMYTCCGRGPAPGLIPEEMSDAKRFAKVFPDVPCLGFYANGEFGPMALAGNENVFQIGRSMHQGVSSAVVDEIFLLAIACPEILCALFACLKSLIRIVLELTRESSVHLNSWIKHNCQVVVTTMIER